MARGKVQRQLIENWSLRSSTYRRRIQGLKKKSYELATLCDIPAFLVSFGPDGQVDTWPESSEEIKDILRRYNSTSGSKVSNKNKIDVEGLLRLEIGRKRKELNRIAMDSAYKLQELIKSVDSKLGEVNQRMQLLGNQHFTGMLETSLSDIHDYPDIGFWEQMADSTSLSDILTTDGEVLEEENNTDSFGLKDCLDDNRNGSYTPTRTMGLSTALPQSEEANSSDQNDGSDSLSKHLDFTSSLTASPFSASFDDVESQIAVDNSVRCPFQASTCYEQALTTDELLLDDEIFDNCQFMGYYDDAQLLCSSSEFGLHITLPVWGSPQQ